MVDRVRVAGCGWPITRFADFRHLPCGGGRPIPIFLVNDPVEGVLTLYASDPHLRCRVVLASELPSDTGFDLPAEVTFPNPRHGGKYDRVGRYVAGPSPRGLDPIQSFYRRDRTPIVTYACNPLGRSRSSG